MPDDGILIVGGVSPFGLNFAVVPVADVVVDNTDFDDPRIVPG